MVVTRDEDVGVTDRLPASCLPLPPSLQFRLHIRPSSRDVPVGDADDPAGGGDGQGEGITGESKADVPERVGVSGEDLRDLLYDGEVVVVVDACERLAAVAVLSVVPGDGGDGDLLEVLRPCRRESERSLRVTFT